MKHISVIVIIISLMSAATQAQIPNTISYQGFFSSGGSPVPDADYDLSFKIFNVLTGGSPLWTEADSGVSVQNGAFSVILGKSTSLAGLDFNQQLYVEVQEGANPPFSPRSALTSAPSALAPWLLSSGNIYYNTGNVGIGTATPGAKLHIGGTAGVDGIRFPDGTTQTTAASVSGEGGWTDDGASVRLTANTDNVGIGTAGPTQKLEVAGMIYSTSGGFKFPNGTVQTTAAASGVGGSGTPNYLARFTGATTLGSSSIFDSAGKIGIGTTPLIYPLEIASNGLPLAAVGLTTSSDVGSSPAIRHFRSRGTLSSKTSIIDGDGLGSIDFYGYDGSSFIGAAAIQTSVSGTPLAGDVGAKMYFRTNEQGGTAGTKIRMMIGENGNVGINTIAPSEKLDVAGVIRSGTGGFSFPDGSIQTTAAPVGSSGWTDNGDAVRLTNITDNVGIGTSSPTKTLHVVGTGLFSYLLGVGYVDSNAAFSSTTFNNQQYAARIIQNGSGAITRYGGSFVAGGSPTTNIAGFFSAANATVENFAIYSSTGKNYFNGNVGIGTSTPSEKLHVIGNICATGSIGACSDGRYKENITPLSSTLENVAALQGVNYYWKRDEFPDQSFSDKKQIGMIAQDVERIYPEIVLTDSRGYKSIDYARLTPVLIEAVKELNSRNDKLERRIATLEKLLTSLSENNVTPEKDK